MYCHIKREPWSSQLDGRSGLSSCHLSPLWTELPWKRSTLLLKGLSLTSSAVQSLHPLITKREDLFPNWITRSQEDYEESVSFALFGACWIASVIWNWTKSVTSPADCPNVRVHSHVLGGDSHPPLRSCCFTWWILSVKTPPPKKLCLHPTEANGGLAMIQFIWST